MEAIFIDGEFYSRENAKVSVFDHGFLFGDGLFETIRAYNGSCFRLQEHLDRLYQSAQILRLAIPYSQEELAAWVHKTLAKNNLNHAYVRITVTRGVGSPGIDPRTCPRPSVIIVALPLTPYPDSAYQQGWEATILATVRNLPAALPPALKSMNFLNNILAKLELIDSGKQEGFFLNHQGYLAEGVVSNIFLVAGQQVLTPAVESGILPGITRRVVLEICCRMELPVEERLIRPAELFQADECFVTNSLAEILPICRVDGQAIGDGIPGPVTKLLHREYRLLVAGETG